ncbi:MAG: hypothetical protein L6427_12500, partial [Actinomycetia bacterium]|nr:hypothetical protein [Actinomycetes bacterium]
YDSAGRRTSMTDPKGEVTTYSYDNAGRLTGETNPIGETNPFTFDATGRILTSTNGEGTTTYTYDPNGNMIGASYPGGLTETASYDKNNRPTGQSGSGITLTLTYDPAGRVKSASNGVAATTATYDPVGNIANKTLTRPAGEDSFSYAYSPDRRMLSATGEQGTTAYNYDPSGRMISKTYPNGIETLYSFDGGGALSSLDIKKEAVPVKTYQVTRDARANVTSVVEDELLTTTYAYDASSRLTGENNPWMGNTTYTYDPAGNRLGKEKQGEIPISYNYNQADQLTSDSGGNSYTYNNRGDLIKTENGTYQEDYTWDGKGRLTRVTDTDGNSTLYSYDPRDRTFASSENDQVQAHIYDMTSDMEIALLDGELNLISLYHSGADGLISSTTDSKTSYFSYNPHSDASLITDATGETTASLHYDAWGNAAEETDEPYNYLGKHQRRNYRSLGLIKMGARFYNPETGRFISRDPLSGHDEIPLSRNPYIYAYDDPVNMRDLSGMCARCDQLRDGIDVLEGASDAFGTGGIWRALADGMRRELDALERKHRAEGKATKPSQPAPKPSCVHSGYWGRGTWQLDLKLGLKLVPIATFSITAGGEAEVTTKKLGSTVVSSEAACEGYICVHPLTASVNKATDHWAVGQTGLKISIPIAMLAIHFKGVSWLQLRRGSPRKEDRLLHPETIYRAFYGRHLKNPKELIPDKGRVYVILEGSRTGGYVGSDYLDEVFAIGRE